MGFGRTSTIDFRVSPSDADFNYDVTSDDCQIELDYLGANTRSGYVTKLTHVTLTKVEQMYDENQKKLQGQYRAYITDQRELKKYDDRLGLVLTVPGQSGSDVQISSSAINVMLKVGEISSFTFKAVDNASVLLENLLCNIEDNMISGRIPHIVEGKKLVPTIKFEGEGKLILHSSPDQNINIETDYSRPVVYDVIDEETKEVLDSYEVYISSFTGLPVLWIETENRAEIVSKDDYIPATYKLVEDVATKGAGSIMEGKLNIRGRGNSTWSARKKPYRLKFDNKESFFGMPKDKHWALLANFYDKTMLRTSLAFYLGSMSNLDFTPESHFVELFLNGQYNGTYELSELIREGKDRLNVGKDGFILEIDNHPNADEVHFNTSRIQFPVRVHEPELTVTDQDYYFIRDYLQEAEDVLFSESFLDENSGYTKYFDIESFAEWYVITELLESPEAGCGYMNKTRNGKLKMGPLWDFDMAVGNSVWAQQGDKSYDPSYMFAREQPYNPYFKRLFQDPRFVSLVKKRFDFFYSKKDEVLSFIEEYAKYLKYASIENENRWNILYNNPTSTSQSAMNIWGSYYNEVQYMKDFFLRRLEFMKSELDQY